MIAVFTTVYNDHEVFEMLCQNMSSLEPKPQVFAMGYPNDPCKEICLKYGFTYFDTDHNLPLGKKNNDCLERIKGLFSHYLYLGSDNLISSELWAFLNDFRGDLFGVLDIYFYHKPKNEFYYWEGYETKYRHLYVADRRGEPVGPCKLMSNELLEKVSFRPWRDDSTRSTDYDMWHNLLKHSNSHTVSKMKDLGGYLIDVKSGQDLTKLHSIPNLRKTDWVGEEVFKAKI